MDLADADTPPDLDTLADQVAALDLPTSSSTVSSSSPGQEEDVIPMAVVSVAGAVPKKPKKLQRGFFDAKPAAKKPLAASKKSNAAAKQPVTLLRANPEARAQVPEGFIIELSEEEKRLAAMKEQLLTQIKPTIEDVGSISTNPILAAGFEDPEVVAAFQEVARDSSAYAKHAKNPKVRRFYEAMGQHVAAKLQSKDPGAAAAQS